jgi:hypothetical protein
MTSDPAEGSGTTLNPTGGSNKHPFADPISMIDGSLFVTPLSQFVPNPAEP